MDPENGSVNEAGRVDPAIYLIPVTENSQDFVKIKVSGEVECSPSRNYNDAKDVSSWSPPKLQSPSSSSISTMKKLHLLVKNITIEPLMFMFVFCYSMSIVTTQSLVIRKFCLQELNLTDVECRNLTNNKPLERQAQEMASTLFMYKMILQTVPSVILVLFLGPWSDKHGRKTIILLPGIGVCVEQAFLISYAYFEMEIAPPYMIIGGIPLALTAVFMVGCSAYISDITTAENRVIRLGLMQCSYMVGSPLGTVVGGAIFTSRGYIAVYITALTISLVSSLYVIFYLKETVQKPDGPLTPCRDFFDLTYVRLGLKTCFQKRENNHRMHLLLLCFAMAINFFPTMGETSVAYLYTRLKFDWTEIMYSYYSAGSLVSSMFGLMLVLPILKRVIKLSDVTIALFGAACRIGSELMTAFAPEGWFLFLTCPFAVFSGMYSPILRGMMSHIVSSQEQGKLFSVLAACENSMPIPGSVLYTEVYNATTSTYPGTVFLMSGVIFVIPTTIFVWIIRDINRRKKNQTKLPTEKDTKI